MNLKEFADRLLTPLWENRSLFFAVPLAAFFLDVTAGWAGILPFASASSYLWALQAACFAYTLPLSSGERAVGWVAVLLYIAAALFPPSTVLGLAGTICSIVFLPALLQAYLK